MRAEKIAELKAFLARPGLAEDVERVPLGHAGIDAVLGGGIERGTVHEVFAAAGHEVAATGFVMGLAARAAVDKRMLWVVRDFAAREFGNLSATGVLELGIDPARILLFHAATMEDALRATGDALSCGALGAVVIEIPGNPKIFDLVASRRLTLAATQKSISVFLLRLGAALQASTAETRWQVRAAPSASVFEDWGHPVFLVDLIRNRHGRTGSWAVEWNCDAYCFQTPAQDRGPVVSAPAH